MALMKPLLCTFIEQVFLETEFVSCSLGDRALSQYINFSGKMVLKRPFARDTDEASAVHIHSTGLLGDRASSRYGRFSGRVVLKRLWISDTGEASGLHFHYSLS